MTWLEFEKDSGRIVCEVKSGGTPSVMEGHEVIPAPEGWDGDLFGWAVENGAAVRLRTEEPEPGEGTEPGQGRIKDLMDRFVLALMDGDEKERMALKTEFRRLKATI